MQIHFGLLLPTVILKGLDLVLGFVKGTISEGIRTQCQDLVAVNLFFIATAFTHQLNLQFTIEDLPCTIDDNALIDTLGHTTLFDADTDLVATI